MVQPWSPQRIVSATLAAALIDRQFPDLAPSRVRPLAAGWDHTAFLVNGRWVFRFPRRQVAVDLLETELRVLPLLSPHLPLPIPVPVYRGRPGDGFAWPFAGYRLLPGRTACEAALSGSQRCRLAGPLGRFLAALHAIGADEAARLGAGPETPGQFDPARRIPQTRENLHRLAEIGLLTEPEPFGAILDEAERLRPCGPRCLVHGDLYARHLIVDESGGLRGVIDWGDVHIGRPAVDLSIAHGFLPPAGRKAFSAAYGPIEEGAWRLARFRALHHAAITALYAHDTADAALLRESLTALAHVAGGA